MTAPGEQALVPGTEYDTGSGANISIQNGPGNALSTCGDGANDFSSIFVDQAVFNNSGQPTTLGVEFDIACGTTSEYIGTAAINLLPTTPKQGYYLYGDDGSLAGFGNDSYLQYLGDLSTVNLNQPIVGMATTGDDAGYWMAASDGGIFAFGDAGYFGSVPGVLKPGQVLNSPIVGIASTHDGGGYWMVAADGGVFAFGDARRCFHGSGARSPSQAGPEPELTHRRDGGHARWRGLLDGGGRRGHLRLRRRPLLRLHGAGLHLNKPIVGMAPTPTGVGYWLVATDGGIFTFGNAGYHGSTGASHLNESIVGMQPTTDGGGYWMVAGDGGVFTFGNAQFSGSLGGLGITNVVGVTS